MTLRDKIIRLAHNKPELRDDLLPLITDTRTATFESDPSEYMFLVRNAWMNIRAKNPPRLDWLNDNRRRVLERFVLDSIIGNPDRNPETKKAFKEWDRADGAYQKAQLHADNTYKILEEKAIELLATLIAYEPNSVTIGKR